MVLLVHDGFQEPAPPGPQVRASIALDKRVYVPGETVLAEVTVTNDGPVAAERLVLDCVHAAANTGYLISNDVAGGAGPLGLTVRGLGETTLAPSESFTTTMSGAVPSSGADVGNLGILCRMTCDGSGERLVMSETEAAVTKASTR